MQRRQHDFCVAGGKSPQTQGACQGVVELFRRGMDTCAIGFDFSPEKNQPTYSKAPPWALNAAPLPPKRVAVTS